MSITAIARNFNGDPNIVTIVSDNTLVELTTTGFWDLAETKDSVALLQNGEWEWSATDLVLIQYDTTLIGFFTYDAVNACFDELDPTGGLSNTLQDGDIFVGNASNIATGVTPSGDITLSNTGVFGIAAGVIVNADINAAAAISYSKLAALASGNILVGSAGNVPTSVAMSGDIAITNTGVTSIQADTIVNADINSAAAIAFSKLATLASGNVLVGSAGGVATSVALSGDATVSNTGVLTLDPTLQLGASGTASSLTLFPPTAANGFFELLPVNAGAAFNTILSNGTMGQTTTYTIPDIGASTGGVVVSTAAVRMKSVAAAAAAGGAVTQSFTDTFCTSGSVVIGNWVTQANAGEVVKIVPGNGSFVVTSTADIGVGTFSYIINK